MSDTKKLVQAIRQFHAGRQQSGLERKYKRLNEGPFEFFRGTAFLFAKAWRELGPRDPGPNVLISGDLHLENFGAYIAADGAVRYDINDFDEAVIAPCGFDVVRCATSTLLAADSWKLGPTHGTAMVLNYLDAYRQQVIEDHRKAPKPGDVPDLGPVRDMLDKAKKRHADESERLSTKGPKFAAVKPHRRKELKKLAREHGWELVDVVRRFAGIGSLGLRRYQLLARNGDGVLQQLSLKQASPSAVRTLAKKGLPRFAHPAERVVWAERQLRGDAIEPLAALRSEGLSFRVRAVIPDEDRADLKRLAHKPDKLRDATAVAGRLTARSQWRGCRAAKTSPAALYEWVTHPTLEAVLAAAVRMADHVMHDYELYQSAYKSGRFD